MTDTKDQEEAIIFYCKDCGEIVKTDKCGRRYVYKCRKCGTKNVAFGTPKSIHGFFKLDGDREDENKSEVKMKKKIEGEKEGEEKGEEEKKA